MGERCRYRIGRGCLLEDGHDGEHEWDPLPDPDGEVQIAAKIQETLGKEILRLAGKSRANGKARLRQGAEPEIDRALNFVDRIDNLCKQAAWGSITRHTEQLRNILLLAKSKINE